MQSVQRHVSAGANVEETSDIIATDRQPVGPRPDDRQRVGHDQPAAGQRDRPRRGKERRVKEDEIGRRARGVTVIVSATLRNDAEFAQAFPAVEITLSDLDENRIAMRRFQPQEYLGDSRNLASGMAPGTTAALVFEVADPGKNAVAFEFKFL